MRAVGTWGGRAGERAAGGLAAIGLLALVTTGVGPVPADAADDATECGNVTRESGTIPATSQDSKPLDEMEVDRAQQFLTTRAHQPAAGAGVTVAVLDSGVVTANTGIPVVAAVQAGAKQPPAYYHGTDVAGLIAGPPRGDGKPVGVAPGAQIFDVQVYDDPSAETTSTDASPITAANVVAGLQQVLAHVTDYHIRVVTIALRVPADPAVADLIDQLWNAGVVTVASTGNRSAERSTDPLDSQFASASPGEDAADEFYPAHYPHVLAVGSSMTGFPGDDPAQAYLLQNSDTAVAAPTASSVSYSVIGGTCVNTVPATSWSAAYVSGVLALDQSYYDESPARAVSRLINTANGRADIPNDLVGAGEVQPLAALTRPLQMDAEGRVLNAPVAQSSPPLVRAPTTPPDVLASTRRNAVWWGLAGGGALLLALMLRPVLARRRQSGHPELRQ